MKMSREQLLEILGERVNVGAIVPTYKYNTFTIHCKEQDILEVVREIREKKLVIEDLYKERVMEDHPAFLMHANSFRFLNYTCIAFKVVVWLPIPVQTYLTILSGVIREVCPDLPGNLPKESHDTIANPETND